MLWLSVLIHIAFTYKVLHVVYATLEGKCCGLVEEFPQTWDLVGDSFSWVKIIEAFGVSRTLSPRCTNVLNNWPQILGPSQRPFEVRVVDSCLVRLSSGDWKVFPGSYTLLERECVLSMPCHNHKRRLSVFSQC